MKYLYLPVCVVSVAVLTACGSSGGGSSGKSTVSSASSKVSSSLPVVSSAASSTLSSAISSASVSSATTSSVAATAGTCVGNYILCDDFDGAAIDTAKWTIANENIGNKYPIRPQNIALTTVEDKGSTITVVDSMTFGDLHPTQKRQGGLLKSKNLIGGGRYEIRMKNLPGPYGCSCFWIYYDSDDHANPPAKRIYTEIDIEMPANVKPAPAWDTAKTILGFNTWSRTERDEDATYINHSSTTVNPFDGEFHVYRFDWYDGKNGNVRIDWYVDDILQATTTEHVNGDPAILYAGAWPAPWPVMNYNFHTEHLYIDWIRVSPL
ncbi:MAG: glycoside hydrolase family 16 protein [Cellvibrio sp.]|uniref:glycoside hydrolase family 16 protein n=1 Tax=Cellvibrio sp. TaxID=1965322 RepID=UPI0031AB76CA